MQEDQDLYFAKWLLLFAVCGAPLLGLDLLDPDFLCDPISAFPHSSYLVLFMGGRMVALVMVVVTNSIVAYIALGRAESQMTTNALKQHKVTKMMLKVVGCFVLQYLPFFMWILVMVFEFGQISELIPIWVFMVLDWTRVIYFTNMAVNPLIYVTSNEAFSQAVSQLFVASAASNNGLFH